jgi:hypothetical protein
LPASAAALGLVALSVACGGAPAVSPSPTPKPAATVAATSVPSVAPTLTATAPPSIAPAPTLAGGFPAGSVIVTFKVESETYRVLVTDADDIAIVNKLLAGDEAPGIPNGVVVRGDPSVNTGWSWHIDPATLDFADVTTEVCDGLPSFVENDEISGDRYCPWSAKVVAVEPANPGAASGDLPTR